jgi:hypothetical protein
MMRVSARLTISRSAASAARWDEKAGLPGAVGKYAARENGLEEVDDGAWDLYFGSLLLGRFDEREQKLYAAFYAHRPWHRGGRETEAPGDLEPEHFHDFHRATTR